MGVMANHRTMGGSLYFSLMALSLAALNAGDGVVILAGGVVGSKGQCLGAMRTGGVVDILRAKIMAVSY